MIRSQNLAQTCFAVLAILHLSGEAQGAVDYNAILEDAVRAIDSEYKQTWAYNETSVDAEATKR